METRKRRTTWWAAALSVALLLGPGAAMAANGVREGTQAVLYEVTENMYLFGQDGGLLSPIEILGGVIPVRRTADATLQGWATVGNPLCPAAVLVTNPKAQTCTVTAAGQDDLSTLTGAGGVGGTYAVVIQDDNRADAAEWVVQNGAFTGDMDLSGRPLGTISGWFCPGSTTCARGAGYSFSGTFRLPFAVAKDGKREEPKRGKAAYYLADDRATLIPIQNAETSLGMPTVRLEIRFQ